MQGESFLRLFLMTTAGRVNFLILSILTADLAGEKIDKKKKFCSLCKTNLPNITENVMFTKNAEKSESVGRF